MLYMCGGCCNNSRCFLPSSAFALQPASPSPCLLPVLLQVRVQQRGKQYHLLGETRQPDPARSFSSRPCTDRDGGKAHAAKLKSVQRVANQHSSKWVLGEFPSTHMLADVDLCVQITEQTNSIGLSGGFPAPRRGLRLC